MKATYPTSKEHHANQWISEVDPVVAQLGCELTTHIQLELRLRMRGATFPLPPYPFIEGTETALPLVNTVGQRLAYHRPKNNDITASMEQTIEKLKITVLWDVMSFGIVETYQCCGGVWCIHFQNGKSHILQDETRTLTNPPTKATII